jgi:uncharacterized protein YigA (DUF484 family)
VEAYLRRPPAILSALLPSILADHPELTAETLLAALPEKPADGNVADFQAHALRHLRKELHELKTGAQDLLQNARTNLSIQTRTHEAALAALAAPSFDVLVRTLSDDLPLLLDVDLVMLCIEQGLPKRAAIYVQELSPGAVDRLVGPRALSRLRPDIDAEPALYGSGVGIVSSDALVRVPLSAPLPPALLALGSRRTGTFHPGQGTDLLVFLAAVVGRCLDRWINP